MNDPKVLLKADHREAKAMLKELAETDKGSERNALARKVADSLTLHMTIEEQLVYPWVVDLIGKEPDEEAQTEHDLAREGIATMLSLTSKPGFGAAVEMLAGGIAHHVQEEESELLPQLKAAMDREAWLSLGDAIAEAKNAGRVPEAATR